MTNPAGVPPIRAELREYARRLVADWPPLNPDQRALLAVLLRPDPAPEVTATRSKRAA